MEEEWGTEVDNSKEKRALREEKERQFWKLCSNVGCPDFQKRYLKKKTEMYSKEKEIKYKKNDKMKK